MVLDSVFSEATLTETNSATRYYIEAAYFAVDYTAADLARLFGGTAASIDKAWCRARDAGRLPAATGGRYSRASLDVTTPQAIKAQRELNALWPDYFTTPATEFAEDDADDDPAETPVDALAWQLGLRPGDDPLLLALLASHGHELPRHDDVVVGEDFMGEANAARLRSATMPETASPMAAACDAYF